MKQLTACAVEWVMDLLIHTNGQTTTLEVKLQLRELGYFAEQSDVSKLMNEIYENGNESVDDNSLPVYTCTDNGTYKIYSFTSVITDEVPTAQNIVDEDEDEDDFVVDEDEDEDTTTTMTVPGLSKYIQGSNSVTIAPSATGTSMMSSREPEMIFYTEKHAKAYSGNDKDWVVTHVNGNREIQLYNEGLTRDQVRSRYASIVGVKIQDVRAKSFANFVK